MLIQETSHQFEIIQVDASRYGIHLTVGTNGCSRCRSKDFLWFLASLVHLNLTLSYSLDRKWCVSEMSKIVFAGAISCVESCQDLREILGDVLMLACACREWNLDRESDSLFGAAAAISDLASSNRIREQQSNLVLGMQAIREMDLHDRETAIGRIVEQLFGCYTGPIPMNALLTDTAHITGEGEKIMFHDCGFKPGTYTRGHHLHSLDAEKVLQIEVRNDLPLLCSSASFRRTLYKQCYSDGWSETDSPETLSRWWYFVRTVWQ